MENTNKLDILPIYGKEHISENKTAILLINLGSPNSTSVEDVASYLKTFLMDKRVISLPYLIRALLVKAIIVPKRAKYSAKNYEGIWEEDTNTFPLVRHSVEIAKKLASKSKRVVALAMRYGKPEMDDALIELWNLGIRKLKVLPLYPHYTRSSFETAFTHAIDRAKALNLNFNMDILPAFYSDKNYRKALSDSVKPYLNNDFDKLIVSMHSIPLSHLDKYCRLENGNTHYCLHRNHQENINTCYRLHCEEAAEFLRKDLGLSKDKFELVYQSRLGKHEWLRPYFADRVKKWAGEGTKKVLVVSPAFICDCLETLQEIDKEYKEMFLEYGGEEFTFIPCLNSSDPMIDVIENLIKD